MLMTEEDPRPAEPAHAVTEQRRMHQGVVSELLSTIDEVERILNGLRALSKLPGYEFIDRLMTGYDWSLEQMQELNAVLIAELPAKPDQTE